MTPWRNNLIVNSLASLLPALLRRDAAYSGLTYFAIGSGESSWDGAPPAPDATRTQLQNESARYAIPAPPPADPADDGIIFLDPATDLPSGGDGETLSRKIQITMTIPLAFEGTLREFALVGGTATGVANSGEMANHVVHGRIDMDDTMELTRQVRLLFETA